MKSLEYMIHKAINIINNNSNANIAVFCNWREAYDILVKIDPDGIVKFTHRVLRAPSGSGISFFQLDEDNLECAVNELAGLEFSHVFNYNITSSSATDHIRCRVRSVYEFTERIGYYDRWGVQRVEDY